MRVSNTTQLLSLKELPVMAKGGNDDNNRN